MDKANLVGNEAERAGAVLAGAVGAPTGEAAIGQGAGNLNSGKELAQREKTWEELTDADRIQRLRRELILQHELVQSQQSLLERLMVHGHLTGGELALPMHMAGRSFAGDRPRRVLA